MPLSCAATLGHELEIPGWRPSYTTQKGPYGPEMIFQVIHS